MEGERKRTIRFQGDILSEGNKNSCLHHQPLPGESGPGLTRGQGQIYSLTHAGGERVSRASTGMSPWAPPCPVLLHLPACRRCCQEGPERGHRLEGKEVTGQPTGTQRCSPDRARSPRKVKPLPPKGRGVCQVGEASSSWEAWGQGCASAGWGDTQSEGFPSPSPSPRRHRWHQAALGLRPRSVPATRLPELPTSCPCFLVKRLFPPWLESLLRQLPAHTFCSFFLL